jgi:hypothetical protein
LGTFTNTAAGLVTDIRDFKKGVSGHEITSDSSMTEKGTITKSGSSSKRFTTAVGNLSVSVIGHSLKAPVALFYNVANGFHNAPAVFLSDPTVRVYPPITGLTSGLVRSGREFSLGLYDAVTGLVVLPYIGYSNSASKGQSSAVGLVKGVGKGIGGLVLKTGAAVAGLPGYGLKGLEREVERWWRGSDAFQHGEDTVITRAKDYVRNLQSAEEGGASGVSRMWDDSKGAGLEKRIVERRVWEGYRHLKELRGMDGSEASEKEICEKWDMLLKEL